MTPGAYGAALAALDLSPGRLRRLLGGADPVSVWRSVVEGRHPEDTDGRLVRAARLVDVDSLWRRCRRLDVTVAVLGQPEYPAGLAGDDQAPAVLFATGDLGSLARAPRVAVVGTRAASSVGHEVARRLGSELSTAGVVVVSGLAPGIDLAALDGAASAGDDGGAPAVAIIGSAHDQLSTTGQRALARRLAEQGAVLSELAPGAPARRWRFASRNRVMAAVADAVVVVESHDRGGAMHTVAAARRRRLPVACVPGSLANRASDGTNALLAAGAACVRHAGDVLQLIGMAPAHGPSPSPSPAPSGRRQLDDTAVRVLDALDGDPATVDTVARRAATGLGATSLALDRLAAAGLAAGEGGYWWSAVSRRRAAGRPPSVPAPRPSSRW